MCPDHPVLCRLGFTKYKEIWQGYPRFFEKNLFRFPAGFHVRLELKEFTVKSGSRVFGACSDRDTLRLASLNPKPNLKTNPGITNQGILRQFMFRTCNSRPCLGGPGGVSTQQLVIGV